MPPPLLALGKHYGASTATTQVDHIFSLLLRCGADPLEKRDGVPIMFSLLAYMEEDRLCDLVQQNERFANDLSFEDDDEASPAVRRPSTLAPLSVGRAAPLRIARVSFHRLRTLLTKERLRRRHG